MQIHRFPSDWPRRETYEHFRQNPCSYSVTQLVDISSLRRKMKQVGQPIAPALLHVICRAVNRLPALRMTAVNGEPSYWEQICPSHTVFHPLTETFSVIWTEYAADFSAFVANYQSDMAKYRTRPDYRPKGNSPAHAINISIAPWLNFSAFNLDFEGRYDYLLPVFTVGRFTESEGRVTLPVAIQANHAACDGYQIALFFDVLAQEIAFLDAALG